jgi:hypothetical protein
MAAPTCPSRGGLMDLLNAMAARRVTGPSGCSPEDVAVPGDVIIQGHGPFEPTVLGEDGAPMQIDLPVHDLVEAPHHADSYEGLNTPKKDPISSTSVSNFSSCSNLFIIHKCHKLHNLILILYLYFSLQSSWFVPYCKDERLKPAVGMLFDTLDEVEEFYKTYAHESGFSVRVGAQTKKSDVVENKIFVCSREGFSKRCAELNKQKKHSESRCGCNARIYVKLNQENRYYIASFVEEHSHGLVSPDKIPFLRSNRTISQRVKTTLFTCHKASIGTSQAYRLLQVSDGFDNIGCMKRDLQNYYRGLREKIKNADAEIFVAQMERKKEANSAFFYDFVVDEHGKLLYVFWQWEEKHQGLS